MGKYDNSQGQGEKKERKKKKKRRKKKESIKKLKQKTFSLFFFGSQRKQACIKGWIANREVKSSIVKKTYNQVGEEDIGSREEREKEEIT